MKTRTLIITTLAAAALVFTGCTPEEAALAGGVTGAVVGASIAKSSNRHYHGYRNGYYYHNGYRYRNYDHYRRYRYARPTRYYNSRY